MARTRDCEWIQYTEPKGRLHVFLLTLSSLVVWCNASSKVHLRCKRSKSVCCLFNFDRCCFLMLASVRQIKWSVMEESKCSKLDQKQGNHQRWYLDGDHPLILIIDHSLSENKGSVICEESRVPWTCASLYSASGKGRGKRTSPCLRSGVKGKGKHKKKDRYPSATKTNKGGSRARFLFFHLRRPVILHSVILSFVTFLFCISFSISFFLARWLIHLYLPRSFSNAPFCPSVSMTAPPPPLRATRNAFLCTRSKKIYILNNPIDTRLSSCTTTPWRVRKRTENMLMRQIKFSFPLSKPSSSTRQEKCDVKSNRAFLFVFFPWW